MRKDDEYFEAGSEWYEWWSIPKLKRLPVKFGNGSRISSYTL